MNKMKKLSLLLIALLVVSLTIGVLPTFAAENSDNNRFNVMIVLDASGSMNNTDPNGYRFDAINQFSNLLAAQGNYLGGIVFSTEILVKQEPIAINSQQNKDQVTDLLHSVKASGWTNIGEALLTSVELLKSNGDQDLPSVIVFLSDGNTEMSLKDKTDISLNKKAEAIQIARENNIPIYTVCLNADKSADISEMEQISKATGGVFREVGAAEDLQGVFNTFYNLIYGTSTIMLLDEEFPSNGIIEKEFEIPGIGVEEVNIVIYGKADDITLTKPNGAQSNIVPIDFGSFSMLKITDVMPGTWKITTSGVPGDQIKINMVYNTNLSVDLNMENEDIINPTDPLKFIAKLKAGNQYASSENQYSGYSAQLHIMDAYGDEITSVPMSVKGDQFELSRLLEEGTYNFKVTVTGNYLNKESETVGPVRVTSDVMSEAERNNTPPEPVESPVQKTVYIWPIGGGKIEIDLNTLATDAQDSDLRYKILSSSFVENTDYTVSEDELLTIDHFSLSKGAFTVRALDSGGLFCDIELVIVTHNVGIMALIGIGAITLVCVIVLSILLYIALNKRFMGACYVAQFDENGNYYEEVKREKGRGRLYLSAFNLKQTDFDARKCYFQASGKNYVYFITNKKTYGNGSFEKKFRVNGDGYEVIISNDQLSGHGIKVRFVSRLNNTNYSF